MRAAAGCIVLVAVGCGPSSFGDFRDQLSARWCNRQVRCGEVGAGDTQHCAPAEPLGLIVRGAVDVPASVAAHHMTFHPDNAKECLAAVDHAPCDGAQAADDLFRSCHGVITGAVANGGACLGDEECLGGGCACGTCVPFAAHDGACVPSGGAPGMTCDPSVMFCNAVMSVCWHKESRGGPCSDDSQCLFDTVCVAGKCADPPRLKPDDVCGTSLPPCADGLYCNESGACAPLIDEGQACVKPNACKPGLTCNNSVCTPWPSTIALPAGTRLGPFARCTSDGDCADGLFCVAGGYCYYVGGLSAPCHADHECKAGLACVGGSCSGASACAPPD